MRKFVLAGLLFILSSAALSAADNRMCLREDAYLKAVGEGEQSDVFSCDVYFQDLPTGSELVQLGMDSLIIKGARKLSPSEIHAYRKLNAGNALVLVDLASILSANNTWCRRIDAPFYTVSGGVKGVPDDLLSGYYLFSASEVANLMLVGSYQLSDVFLIPADKLEDVIKTSKNTVFYSSQQGSVQHHAENFVAGMARGVFFTDASHADITQSKKMALLVQKKNSSIPDRYRCGK
jgi:hypothetical protein